MIIQRLLLLATFITILQMHAYSQYSGKIFSAENKQPIAYASILILDREIKGTTSDSAGYFSLTASPGCWIRVSAVGFHDTLIPLPKNTHALTIHLKEKIYTLPEIIVSSTGNRSVVIGLPNGKPNGEQGWKSKLHGIYNGIYMKTKKNDIGKYIDSIRIYIPSSGAYNTKLGLRLLTYPKPHKLDNHSLPANDFIELLPELVTFKAPGPGWYTIDLTQHAITLPEDNLWVLFGMLDTHVNTETTPILGIYDQPFNKFLPAFYDTRSNRYFIIKIPFIKKQIPMIIIYLN